MANENEEIRELTAQFLLVQRKVREISQSVEQLQF